MARTAVRERQSAPSRMVHIRISPDLHRKLRLVVAAADTSVQDWVEQTIERAVSEQLPKITERKQ